MQGLKFREIRRGSLLFFFPQSLSKMEAGKMELENIPFVLEEQIQQVYDTLHFKAEEKGLIFETVIANDVPDVLKGDPSRLNQILINLTGNSIKFTDKGSVDITGTIVTEHKTPILLIKVSDTGIGIERDKIDKISKCGCIVRNRIAFLLAGLN